MYHAGSERACGGLFSFLAGVIVLIPIAAGAATISFSGINEGSQITLPVLIAATNLTVTATISGAGGSPSVHWKLERQGTIFQNVTSGPPNTVTFSSVSSGKYFLSGNLLSDTNVSADLSFDIRAASLQPANDNWNQTITITNLGLSVTGNTAYATAETGEPMHADNGGGHSVWWKWQAASNGLVSITTAGSTFDTVVGVYKGTNVGALTPVAANDDAGSTNRSSQVSFTAAAGETYHIAVDGALLPDGSVANGAVQWQLLVSAPSVLAFLFPTNGQSFFVPAPLTPTNLSVAVSISDPIGLRRAEYLLDGPVSRTGILSAPYQLILSNLLAGDYLLTMAAVNNSGLISAEHVSFSIVPLAPEIRFVDARPADASGFRFAVTGLKGMNYELQSSTNVPVWNRLTLWTNFAGAQRITDTNAPKLNTRFYRVIAP